MHRFGRITVLVVMATFLGWGISRAALGKYEEKRKEILAACKAELEKLGVAERKLAAEKCPTPEVHLVSPAALTPGEVVDITVSGKFPAGTRFLFQSDNLDVVKESVSANSYRATVKVAAEAGPEKISLQAFCPYSCKGGYRSEAVAITGKFAYDFKAANGWRIKANAVPPSEASNRSSDLRYMVEFFRGEETTAFARRSATMLPSAGSSPRYYFSISQEDPSSTSAQAEYMRLGEKLSDPKLTLAEREKLMKQLEPLMAKVQEEMKRMSDPAYFKKLQAQQEEFGCEAINAVLQNGALSGNLRCSQKVGRDIKLTGSVKFLGK